MVDNNVLDEPKENDNIGLREFDFILLGKY